MLDLLVEKDWHEWVEWFETELVAAVRESLDVMELAHTVENSGEVFVTQVVWVEIEFIGDVLELSEGDS